MNCLTHLQAPLCLFSVAVCSLSLQAAEPSASHTVTLEECLKRVTERSPDLKAGAYRTEASAYRTKKASRPLNPRLGTEVENIAGSGDVQNFDVAETTVAVSQELELGGKRRHRTAAAETETAVSRSEQAAHLQTLLTETRRAALALLAAQQKTRLAEEELALVREIESVAVSREQAGKATALETERARAETAQAQIAAETRMAEQHDAVRDLALCWGETEPAFAALAEPFATPPAALPPLDTLLLRAATNPDLLAADARFRASQAGIDVERSTRVPNLEVTAGMRRFEESGDFGFVAGVAVELPLFTRNMDGVRAAEADAEAWRLEATSARLKTEGRIRQLYARLAALDARIRRLKETSLPLTERALALVRQAHQQGKAGYLDVLEARRSLVEARLRFIDTVTEYDGLRISLDRLTNTSSSTL
ncbi:MAG: TolC family protein [bacterium]